MFVVGRFFFVRSDLLVILGCMVAWTYLGAGVGGSMFWLVDHPRKRAVLSMLLVGSRGGGWYIVGYLGRSVMHVSIGDA